MKKVGVALLGLGTVGYGTYRILTENRENIKKIHGVDIEVKCILERNLERVRALGVPEAIVSQDINTVLNDKDISVVAEFFGGIEPARSFLVASLKAGKSIVTANKEMFAKNRNELAAAAKETGAGIYFEASCVGGVPIIRTLTEGLQGDKITAIKGIFNGTTNYILSKMSNEGLEYADVLKEAQALGYAEANPSADVDGYDAMYKLSILASLAFRENIALDKIKRQGISKISKKDIVLGKKYGYMLKLIAAAEKAANGAVAVRVAPAFLKNAHPLASVSGSFNAVMVKGSYVGDIMLYGRGAGDLPTGSAIVSDIVFASLQTKHKMPFENQNAPEFNANTEDEYYVRLSAEDRSGVLAQIADVWAREHISIRALEQIPSDGDTAEIVFFTHKTGAETLNEAIAQIKSSSFVKTVDAIIRIEQ
ncbi:MAG: homoserine dehydrogenase [Christensenellaceae bacterium]|jgi:homoserine dehydrogenase|nr:homoserine dehydrogenase [Christensenellaceae bacterium]